jgi:1A family penicillin-binding protein
MNVLRSFWFRHLGLLIVDSILIATTSFFVLVQTQLPQIPENLGNLNPQSGVNIYATDGTLLYSLNRSRTFVPLKSMSPDFVNAVLATEDVHFYDHRGFSLKALIGAFADNLMTWQRTRGGSTITQQIVKNIFLTREKSYFRKIKELLIALQLETMFERTYGARYKDQLLELYINGSFYGTNAYGVEDAAQVYFGRPASNLSLLQSAILAGLPNAPSAYRPVYGDSSAVATATRRAAHVLNRMTIAGHISSTQRDQALTDSLHLNPKKRIQNRTPYLVETIKEEISRRWGGSALSFGALDIHTTLDIQMQKNAQRSVDQGVLDLDTRLGFPSYQSASAEERKNYVQVALLCVDYRTGHVKAMIGGRDIFTSYYNRATTARRQPGSGFKPIVYLSAFESGEVTPLTTFIDEPRTYIVNRKGWAPKNFQDSYLGLTTAAWALIRSANATSVQIVQKIGPDRVVETARRLGVSSPLLAVPSIALGSNEVTMLDLVTAYGTIANTGLRVDPTFITRIIDRNTGQLLYQHRPSPVPTVDPVNAYTVTRLMENVINRGTGYAVRRLGFSGRAAGKTGTTNDNTDAWFTGFTPELVTSVWVGFDSRKSGNRLREEKTRRQITGGSGAAPIWTTFMKTVPKSVGSFYAPSGVHEVEVDPLTGSLPSEVSDSTSIRPVRIAVPTQVSPNPRDSS